MKGGWSLRALGFLVAVMGALGSELAWPASPDAAATAFAPPSDTNAVTRGAQLAALGDCMTCHTARDGAPFAGGRPLATPFGTLYSTNITPDRDTGIGNWSLDDFTRAMREGVSRDGHRLYPAFPYPHFTKMSDADIASLYAWLMTRDAVHASAPANRLMFPLGFRPLIAVWDWLYLHPGPSADTAAAPGAASNPADAQRVARGRYLVESVGHCGACHTPLNRLGAEERDHTLQGGTLEGWDAPALATLSARPKPWTQAQLADYLRTGFASEHGAAAGPMRPVTEMLADAPPGDVEAIAAYLIHLDSESNMSSSPSAASQAVPNANGATLFAAACASCHGATAPLMPNSERPSLSLSTAVNAASPRNVVRILLDGIDWQGSAATHFMPPFAGTFTDAQIADLANYTRERYTAHGAWSSLDADAVARYRKESSSP